MPRFPFAALPFLALSSLPAVAQEATPPAPAPDVAPIAPATSNGKSDDISSNELAALIRQLKQMRAGLDTEERKIVAAALKELGNASVSTTSAMNLWVDSVRAVDFDQKKKKQTEFEEWRKKNDERMHDITFCTGLLFQCRYLKLCLEADTPEKQAKSLPAIQALMEEAVKTMPKMLNNAGMLREDAFASIMARALRIEKMCPEGWPRALLRPDEHYGRFIRSARKENASAVVGLWEARIRMERAIAKASDDNAKLRRSKEARTAFGKQQDKRDAKEMEEQDTKFAVSFEKETLPRLMWSMGEDFFKAGLRRRGIETMFQVITKNPKHPNVSDWVDRITAIAEEVAAANNPPAAEGEAASGAETSAAPAE